MLPCRPFDGLDLRTKEVYFRVNRGVQSLDDDLQPVLTSRGRRDEGHAGAADKKMIYARVVEQQTKRTTREVQAALEKADAGRLLFGKA